MSQTMQSLGGGWGLFDTQDLVWMGDEKGPRTYDDYELAKLAAMVVDVRLGQVPGRTQAALYMGVNAGPRDTREAKMSTQEALEILEKGQL